MADKQAQIERLLLRAERLRFGVPEKRSGHGAGARPRADVHSFPNHPSLAHSLAADKQADVASAERLYKEAAALGSAVALNELGEMAVYTPQSVSGREPNRTAALEYWRAAAELGNPEAQHHLSVFHWLGLGESGRPDEAVAMLHDYFAAAGGNPLAKLSLGYRHMQGLSAPQSCDAAVAYYQQVAEEVVSAAVQTPVQFVVERARLADERARSVPPEEDEDVIHYYQHSAENGDVAAQVALGHLHFYGARGFEQNPERAARYFRAAAAQGDAAAMSSLGQMHVQGLGVAQNNATAFKYLSDAAARHNPAAQNGLGYLHLHGQGTAKDYKAALGWFKKAADQGHAEAQFNLGAMYFAGLGVDKKYATALQYFMLSSAQGYTRALYNLAQMHLHGLGTIKSCALGLKLHKSVAERGSHAQVLSEAHRHFLKGNMEVAWLLYARAAEEGHEVAQANSAWMLDQGLAGAMLDAMPEMEQPLPPLPAPATTTTAAASEEEELPVVHVSRRHVLAHRHWQMAAAQGNVDSLRMLGDYAFAGLVTGRPDYAAALRYYTQAGEHRHAQSLFNLAYMYEQGLGTPEPGKPDFHLAKRFYDACLDADADAIVPVKLALAKLYAKAWWEETFAEPKAAAAEQQAPAEQKNAKDVAATSASAPATDSPSWFARQWRASGAADWVARLRTAAGAGAVELFLQLEDVLLALLCAALAVVVYFRSQRR